MTETVQQPLLRGVHAVAGLWLPAQRFAEPARQALLLTHWRAGSRAWRFADGDLLRWPAPQRQPCEPLLGWPLILLDGTLCSAPLLPRERAGLPAADAWLIRGGQVQALRLVDAEPLQPGHWLCMDGYVWQDTYEACPPATSPSVVDEAPRPLRQVLGNVVQAPPGQRAEVMQALAANTGARKALAPRRQAHAFVPGFLERWLGRFLDQSRLGQVFGKRQAAYLRRMLDLFEQGQMAEALRHAIPLDSAQQPGPPAFGTPTPRADLRLRTTAAAPARSLNLPEDFSSHLRQVYRASFARLDREGRIDEAVFVLAELLSARQEALDYLEAHQRFQQAAELALAWDQPAAAIVRHLCLADDWERAVQVARRDSAFAEAVLALQGKWPGPAARLRLEWANWLADQGRWLPAVDAVWPLADERPRAVAWLLSAEAGGEALAAEALVKRAVLLPDTLARYEEYVLAVRDDPARGSERSAIALALLHHECRASAACAQLAIALLGAVVEDRAVRADVIKTLVTLANDPWLRADMPALDYRPEKPTRWWQLASPPQWQAPAAGVRAVLDARVLDADRSLVALGESGVAVVNAQGRALAYFAVPASHLVMGDSRQVALALIRRESVWRVSKLDLANRGFQDLGVLALDSFARHFNGSAWSVAKGNHLRVLDVDRGLATLWQVPDLPGPVWVIGTRSHEENILLNGPDGSLERWCYRLPERRLQARDPVARRPGPPGALAFGGDGSVLEFDLASDGSGEWAVQAGKDRYPLPALDERYLDSFSLTWNGQHLVVVYPVLEGQQQVRFFDAQRCRLLAKVSWPDRVFVHVQDDHGHWLLFDAQGRLLCLDHGAAAPRTVQVQALRVT